MNFIEKYRQQTASPDQVLQIYEETYPVLGDALGKLPDEIQKAWVSVVGNSNFLARWTRRYPDRVKDILLSDLNKTWSLEEYHQSLDTPAEGPDEQLEALLAFKYWHLYRISLRDLGLHKDFDPISSEISALAYCILQKALKIQWNGWVEKIGNPMGKDPSMPMIPFTILALGKLGGNELNYSSDIDIIYCHGSDQGTLQKNGKLEKFSPLQFFTKVGESLGSMLSKKTPQGFLYRVDLELRPEGASGTLTNSLEAFEAYYETFGAFWEKQAMIKLSYGGGSQSLFQDFAKLIRPFVYPKSSDMGLIEKIVQMKQKVEDSLKHSSQKGFHVKLDSGGIREIEFFIQTFQVLHGGKVKSLRQTNTLKALMALHNENLIDLKVYQGFKDAYVFLRTLENRLQQVEEQQTHRLPTEEKDLESTAKRMGYSGVSTGDALENFLKDLNFHKNFVEDRFASLMSGKAHSLHG